MGGAAAVRLVAPGIERYLPTSRLRKSGSRFSNRCCTRQGRCSHQIARHSLLPKMRIHEGPCHPVAHSGSWLRSQLSPGRRHLRGRRDERSTGTQVSLIARKRQVKDWQAAHAKSAGGPDNVWDILSTCCAYSILKHSCCTDDRRGTGPS